MKKFLSVLMAGLVVFMMFGVGGGKVLAAPKPVFNPGPCDCGMSMTMITGAEKNKAVSDLLSSDIFNNVKKQAEGNFKWRGADQIAVAQFGENGPLGYMVPFYTKEGKIEVFGFLKIGDLLIFTGQEEYTE